MNCNEWIAQLPKMDLHCHLDGAVSPERMKNFLREQGEDIPADFMAQISVDDNCPDLPTYLRCFDLPLRWLQTEDALAQAVEDLLEAGKKQNIRYMEIRFAPDLFRDGGLSYEAMFRGLERGREEGQRRFGVACRFMICAMRHFPVEQNVAMLEGCKEFYPGLICGADLAGDEVHFPVTDHEGFFRRCRELGIPFTIHAGETGSTESVENALDLGACRLGHGIAAAKDEKLMERCRRDGIGIEMCPTSNFQTKAAEGWGDYPLKEFLRRGILVTLNTDDPTVSTTDLNREYTRAMEEGGLTRTEVLRLLENGCTMSFAPDEVKERYRTELAAFLPKR